MPPAIRRHAPGLALLALSRLAPLAGAAPCVAEGPLATARWIFQQAYYFHVQATPRQRDFLSPGLLADLTRRWACPDAGQACAPLLDPWTGAAQGQVQDPVVFSLRATPPERSQVAMRFLFGGPGAPAPEPATAELILVRDAGDGCYRLDDVISRNGLSLRDALAP